MSISALLTNADEPANDNHNTNTRVPQSSKPSPIDRTVRHSPEMTTKSIARQAPATRAAPSASFHTADVDVTDTEQGASQGKGSGKKSGSFQDFKYHDSMNLADNDPDKTDTEVDDDDTFAAEKVEYLKNSRKRHIEVEDQEAEKRKVECRLRFLISVKGLVLTIHSDVALFTRISSTTNSTTTPELLATAPVNNFTTTLWNR